MRIGFNTNYYNTFTKSSSSRDELKNQPKKRNDEIGDVVEITAKDKKSENEADEPYRSPITQNTVNKFIQFYYGLPEEDRASVHCCLMGDEERYEAILSRMEKIEGKDRYTRPKKSFRENLLDLMMLSDPAFDVGELTYLPAFENGKNEDVYKLLKELSDPPIPEETGTEQSAEADELEYDNSLDEDDLLLADDEIDETEENKPAKIGFFKRMAALFATAR